MQAEPEKMRLCKGKNRDVQMENVEEDELENVGEVEEGIGEEEGEGGRRNSRSNYSNLPVYDSCTCS